MQLSIISTAKILKIKMICKYLGDYLSKYLQIYQLLTINYQLLTLKLFSHEPLNRRTRKRHPLSVSSVAMAIHTPSNP